MPRKRGRDAAGSRDPGATPADAVATDAILSGVILLRHDAGEADGEAPAGLVGPGPVALRARTHEGQGG
ncbi:hypothetical protein PKCBPO_01302 [Methylorubrum thiocyanatum]|jgi:hypothetical protein